MPKPGVTAFEKWLKAHASSQRRGLISSAVFAGVLACIVLFLTFWFTYLVIWSGMRWALPDSHAVHLAVSGGVLAFLFLGDLLANRRELEQIEVPHFHDDESYHPYRIRLTFSDGATLYYFGIGSQNRAFVRLVASLLLMGPRLTRGTFEFLGMAARVIRVDVESCATLLYEVAAKGERMPFEKLFDLLPPEKDFVAMVEQLQELGVVVVAKSKPMGLFLSSDVERELIQLYKSTRKKRRRSGT